MTVSLGKLPWGKVLGIDEMSLVLDEIAQTVPAAMRAFDETDTWATPTTQDDEDNFFYRIKPAALEASGDDMRVAIAMKTLFADGYVKARREDDDGSSCGGAGIACQQRGRLSPPPAPLGLHRDAR